MGAHSPVNPRLSPVMPHSQPQHPQAQHMSQEGDLQLLLQQQQHQQHQHVLMGGTGLGVETTHADSFDLPLSKRLRLSSDSWSS